MRALACLLLAIAGLACAGAYCAHVADRGTKPARVDRCGCCDDPGCRCVVDGECHCRGRRR